MEPKDRIIVALDIDQVDKATHLVTELSPHVGLFKIGLELIYTMLVWLVTAPEADEGARRLEEVQGLFRALGGRVFLDGKLMDIPNTVAGAMRALARLELKLANVHCLGGAEMMKAASGVTGRPKLLGVTLLTSLNYDGLQNLGLMPMDILREPDRTTIETRRVEQCVARLALMAKSVGLDGVIASPREIAIVREGCGKGFLIVTPGVRPEWAAAGDQKRVMTPGEAVKAGADYLVIGRPITQPPSAIGTPVDAACKIADEIAAALAA